jgi:hypothetical protein
MDGKAKVGETKGNKKLADRNIQCFSATFSYQGLSMFCAFSGLCCSPSVYSNICGSNRSSHRERKFCKKEKKCIVSI